MIAALSVAVLSGYSMNGPFWAISTSLLPGAAAAAGIALINAMEIWAVFTAPMF